MKKKRCLSVVIISLLLGISCFIMAGCANKDYEDKDDTKIEQNLDKKEDAEDFNKKDEEADENKKVEEDEDEDENSREARVYYVDDITGEIMGKTITVKTEYDIWKALQGNGILTEGCQLLSFKVNEETHLIDQIIGTNTVKLTTNDPNTNTRLVRNSETNLGDIVTDAYRVVLNTDIAICNGGAIRNELPMGDFSYNDILTTFPFGNM